MNFGDGWRVEWNTICTADLQHAACQFFARPPSQTYPLQAKLMPTYKYRREDGTTFTIRQKITADALEECPETGQSVERVIQPASFHLKGSGFYSTDYQENGTPKQEQGSGSKSSDADGSSAQKTESADQKSEASAEDAA